MLRPIQGLAQAFRSQNLKFDLTIKSYGYYQVVNEHCIYKRIEEGKVVFLLLYVDDILLIGNDVGSLIITKVWLTNFFDMKDLGQVNKESKSFVIGEIGPQLCSKNYKLTRSYLDLTLRTPRKGFNLFDVELNFLRSNLLRMLKKKKT